MATLTGNTIASTYAGLLSVSGAVGADTVEAVTDGAGTSTSLSLSQQRATITLGSGSADDFIVDGTTLVVEGDNNRVGIGTATPTKLLDLTASGTLCALAMNTSEGGSFLIDALSTSANPVWRFNVNSSEEITWAVGGARKITMDTVGRLGIGEPAPHALLMISAS